MATGRYTLADRAAFHDACGTGFIAELNGRPGRRVVTLAIEALQRLTHRGARAADRRSVDGSGLLTDLPRSFFEKVAGSVDGRLAVAMVFSTPAEADRLVSWCDSASIPGVRFVGRRRVPIAPEVLGEVARASCPLVLQFFFSCTDQGDRSIEQQLYLLRRSLEQTLAREDAKSFICSLSSKTIIYKGMMASSEIHRFYPDLADADYRVRVAVFHERFATNTAPSWPMAQPFRFVAHNGEINTIKGNRLWMRAREREIRSELWGDDLQRIAPIVNLEGSDSLSLDNALEFLTRSGRSCFHAVMMLIPDPYRGDARMPRELRDFFVYHENVVEPWDGPAALVFTDGDVVGAKLDRNGLRPLRYTITRDGLLIMASEAGIVDVEPDNLELHHHMTSGEIFAVGLDGSGILTDDRIKARVADAAPYSELLSNLRVLPRSDDDEEEFGEFAVPDNGFDVRLRIALGWTKDELTRFLIPMAESGREPVASMGDDSPPAFLSDQPRRLFDFFKQSFAQVTNPPVDPIRERFVFNLCKYLGSEDFLLAGEPGSNAAIRVESPILSPRELRLLLQGHDWFPHARIPCHARLDDDLEERLSEIERRAEEIARGESRVAILTDENLQADQLPIPMALVVSAVHHHLVRQGIRNRVSLVCVTGDLVEDHHAACLIALGASAVYPYMAYELIRERFADDERWPERMSHYRYALEKGLLKILAKMGISTVSSYHGSMLLHGIGLSPGLLERFFPSIECSTGGIGLDRIRKRLLELNRRAFAGGAPKLEEKGYLRFRKGGERHAFAPARFKWIHQLAAGEDAEPPAVVGPIHLRDLLELRHGSRAPIEQVESCGQILRRFGAGAISFGAISNDVHRILARAMDLVGGRSNTGEGGESPDRYAPGNPDKSMNCIVKQIASGRFGVTTDYLSAARELQIKMAQGAKPGEGGQLPGHKVTLEIATARGATPGVPLISPPPHHDIYSIEDIAQLIFDLKAVNPRVKVSVKLVSQPGVGIVACGVVKAGADIVLISGGDGGTGASPAGSIRHTGLPWELGLAETHQSLSANGLRSRVTLRVDGGIATGRDIVIAALLGAEEYDFGTSLLVALGCVMARQCHLNTCPVGIATQDPEFRRRFKGTPEQVERYLRGVAEDVREHLSRLGAYSLLDVVGRTGLLGESTQFAGLIDERGVDLDAILNPGAPQGIPLESDVKFVLSIPDPTPRLDESVIEETRQAIMTHGQAVVHREIRNTDRAVGARLSGELSFLHGRGNFNGNIQIRLRGVAGQSLGAFLTDGVELRLRGAANDYVAKGMSGGLITIRMPKDIRDRREAQTIIGNVALYGGTGGMLLVGGRAGERFAVRNSGASAVVEGVGNHCCEYMTRGTVVVLGEFGRNFGAGMTGGVAYIWIPSGGNLSNLNKDFVRAAELLPGDESLIQRLLRRHVFHCGSVLADSILGGWDLVRDRFHKIVPLAQDILDFREVYDEHVSARMGVLLNE